MDRRHWGSNLDTQNLYMMVFNDLFIYFFAVVVSVVNFPLFGASEDLIRNSQRLYFCNSGRL